MYKAILSVLVLIPTSLVSVPLYHALFYAEPSYTVAFSFIPWVAWRTVMRIHAHVRQDTITVAKYLTDLTHNKGVDHE